MTTYKLIGTKPDETPDEAIIRCANNLVKAVLASGRTLHVTSGVSGFEIDFYKHRPGDIHVQNICGGWGLWGKSPLKITFKPEEPANDFTQDDAGDTQSSAGEAANEP